MINRLVTTVRMVSTWRNGHARLFFVAPCERRRLAVLGTISRVYVPKIARRSKAFCELGFGSWVALHHGMDDLQLRHVETVSLRRGSTSVMAWLRHLCRELRDFQWGLDYWK